MFKDLQRHDNFIVFVKIDCAWIGAVCIRVDDEIMVITRNTGAALCPSPAAHVNDFFVSF